MSTFPVRLIRLIISLAVDAALKPEQLIITNPDHILEDATMIYKVLFN